MIVYFQGGSLDGHVLPDINKRAKSISNPLPDGRKEWYRQTGKKVTISVKSTKEKAPARVYRFDCVMDPPKPHKKRVRFVAPEPVAFVPVPSGVHLEPSGMWPTPSGCGVPEPSGAMQSPLGIALQTV